MVKKNKYPRAAEAELDLHGLTALEAEAELLNFLAEAKKKKYARVRIITGKGLNSPDGRSVLKPLVEDWLRAKHYQFTMAKMNEGGEGAVEVVFS